MNSEGKHSIYYHCSAEKTLKKHICKTKAAGWITIVILAKLDIADEEYVNAKTHLEYVMKYGNKMSAVEEAQELLDIIKYK